MVVFFKHLWAVAVASDAAGFSLQKLPRAKKKKNMSPTRNTSLKKNESSNHPPHLHPGSWTQKILKMRTFHMFPWNIVFWIIHLSEISVKLRRSVIPTYTISTSFQIFEAAEGFNCPFSPGKIAFGMCESVVFVLGNFLKSHPDFEKKSLIFIQNHIFTLTN